MARALSKFVRRYTTLSSALDTLNNRMLTLLSTTKWDDTNDAYFMEIYRTEAKLGSVLALCCTMATETYHHWRVFTQGLEGVCLEFDRGRLEAAIGRMPELVAGPVEYKLVKDLERLSAKDINRLPFIKRDGYSDEREWRVIANCSKPALQTLDIPIDPSWINRVILNPWLPPPLFDTIRGVIQSFPECGKLSVVSSRLTNSSRWKAAGEALTK